MKSYQIPVSTITFDNGDGSTTTRIYPNDEALLNNHPMAPLTDDEREDILNNDDTYENGAAGKSMLDIIIGEDGTPRVPSEGWSFYGNQQ